jgi:ribosome-binding factor A
VKSTPRTRKLNERVRAVVAEVLHEEVADPRLEFVTVTSVEVSPDLRHADIYVIAHGDEERYRTALDGLASASNRIRASLGRRVSMKYVPELRFLIDPSVDAGMRMSEVIRQERARLGSDEADS